MSDRLLKITSLPTRYEPLVRTFGEKAKTTFVPATGDLEVAKRLAAAAESGNQGKILFVRADSGAGKSTFVHSLEIFLADRVSTVVRVPPPHELPVPEVSGYLARLPILDKMTVVNFDGREAPHFSEPEYQTFLGGLNGMLRTRSDLLVLWPVTDDAFATKLVQLLDKVGGRSAFGPKRVHELQGLAKSQYALVLEKILQIANWRLEDAAVTTPEVDGLVAAADKIGTFLDSLQKLVTERFEVSGIGIEFPTLVLAVSSSEPRIREICRSLRRADSFYIEASRLLMYTKKSNAAEWWANRATDLKSALPHVIALFNAQLVTLSASSVVHAIMQFGIPELKDLVRGVRADRGNARRVTESSELYKWATDQGLDSREYGSSVKDETFSSYDRIQAASETHHKGINQAILTMAADAGAKLDALDYEVGLVAGLQTDAAYSHMSGKVALEFHHKANKEFNANKLAIYVLEKLKEYAINFGLAAR
jgi:hypothetical protein